MADVDSVINSSTVTDILLVSVLHPDSVVNSSIVSDVSVSLVLKPDSLVNVSTVDPIRIIYLVYPDSISSTSSVPPIFIHPGIRQTAVASTLNVSEVSEVSLDDKIIVSSVINTSIVTPISIPLKNTIFAGELINVESFGSVIVKVQQPDTPAVVPTNPIVRPIDNILPKSERTIDGQIGERVAIFKDLAMSFIAHPLTGEPVRVLNYNSVNQAFKNIILTNRKERPFSNIELGSNIKASLFEINSPARMRDLKEEIQRSILNFDPRVIINKITSEITQDQHGVILKIEYKIKTFEKSGVFEMFLERI